MTTLHTPIHTWLDGYLALRHRAFEMRGSIVLSTGERWPRTTGAEVMVIAAAFDPVVRAHALPRVLRRWRATLADLQRDGRPWLHHTYAGNRAFWSALEAASIFLDDLELRPPGQHAWDALLDVIGTGPRNVGPRGDGPFTHFEGVRTFDDLYNAQRRHLGALRGFDRLRPDGGVPGPERPIPRTTNADVVALADYWTRQLADVKTVMGTAGVTTQWRAAVADVNSLARHGDPNAVYAHNNAFWRALQQTAIHVAVADEAPSKWDMVKDSVTDSVTHLPETLGGVASKGAEVLAETAQAAGKVVNAAGKGLFSGIGTPVVIGAGLLGAFLLFRRGRRDEEA